MKRYESIKDCKTCICTRCANNVEGKSESAYQDDIKGCYPCYTCHSLKRAAVIEKENECPDFEPLEPSSGLWEDGKSPLDYDCVI